MARQPKKAQTPTEASGNRRDAERKLEAADNASRKKAATHQLGLTELAKVEQADNHPKAEVLGMLGNSSESDLLPEPAEKADIEDWKAWTLQQKELVEKSWLTLSERAYNYGKGRYHIREDYRALKAAGYKMSETGSWTDWYKSKKIDPHSIKDYIGVYLKVREDRKLMGKSIKAICNSSGAPDDHSIGEPLVKGTHMWWKEGREKQSDWFLKKGDEVELVKIEAKSYIWKMLTQGPNCGKEFWHSTTGFSDKPVKPDAPGKREPKGGKPSPTPPAPAPGATTPAAPAAPPQVVREIYVFKGVEGVDSYTVQKAKPYEDTPHKGQYLLQSDPYEIKEGQEVWLEANPNTDVTIFSIIDHSVLVGYFYISAAKFAEHFDRLADLEEEDTPAEKILAWIGEVTEEDVAKGYLESTLEDLSEGDTEALFDQDERDAIVSSLQKVAAYYAEVQGLIQAVINQVNSLPLITMTDAEVAQPVTEDEQSDEVVA